MEKEERCDKLIKRLCESKETFTVVSKSSSITLTFDDGEQTILKDKLPSDMQGVGLHLCKMVEQDVKDRVEDKDYVPVNQDNDRKHVKTVLFNTNSIKKNVFEKVYAIDIDSCYFTTAYLIGAMSKELFDNGIKNPKWKLGRNISIGRLGAGEIITTYKKGKHIDVYRGKNPLNVVRLDIIDSVWDFAQSVIAELGNDFLMFLTDCFYVTESAKDKVVDFIEAKGYKCDVEESTIIESGVDNNVRYIKWIKGFNPKPTEADKMFFKPMMYKSDNEVCFV